MIYMVGFAEKESATTLAEPRTGIEALATGALITDRSHLFTHGRVFPGARTTPTISASSTIKGIMVTQATRTTA